MNFPDLETCRAIGAEFPDSEYVWANLDGTDLKPEPRKLLKKSLTQDMLINAPTCEELLKRLGEYFKDKCDPNKSSFEDFNEWHDFSISHVIFEENPAQMLAVELQGILEHQQ